MSFNLTGLTAYTDEMAMDLIKKSVLGGRTLQLISIQPGIKSSATINIIGTDLVAQLGSCGWNAEGETILSQRDISVCPLKINEALCIDDLEAFYTQKMMRPGSYNTEIPFEGIYADQKAENIAALIEDLIWKGDTDNGVGNLALCDGFIKLFGASGSGVVDGNPAGLTALSPTNIIDVVDNQVSLINTDVINANDLYVMVGYDTFRTYAKALRDANLFHYTGEENQGGEFTMMVPGTNVRIVATRGLNNTNVMVTGPASNLYFGTDLLNDYESFTIKHDDVEDDVKFRAKWKQGVNVAFPEYVVFFELA
jgi:hypothetical protein